MAFEAISAVAEGQDAPTTEPRTNGPEVSLSMEAAFSEFFAATRAPMFRLAFLLTGSRTQAEEAVQESMVRLVERWATVDDHPAYLRRAVVNRCTSWHRHRAVVLKTRSKVATDEAYTDQPDELTDAIAALPTRRRAVIVLRYYERLDLEEIAQALDVSVGTVKSTLHRALAQLKGILE